MNLDAQEKQGIKWTSVPKWASLKQWIFQRILSDDLLQSQAISRFDYCCLKSQAVGGLAQSPCQRWWIPGRGLCVNLGPKWLITQPYKPSPLCRKLTGKKALWEKGSRFSSENLQPQAEFQGVSSPNLSYLVGQKTNKGGKNNTHKSFNLVRMALRS